MARDLAWRGTVALAGLLVPGLGYVLRRRPALAAATMAGSIALAALALKIIPSPLGPAILWPAGIAYAVLVLASAAHAAALPTP
ncbi:MAG: hypothetical protein IPL79_17150 [Myxococcales bacterium]|nr:hypothetical protein [Myxococcales bacterium]